MKFENISPEQLARARECKSMEEILALVKEEGFELTDEQLEAIAGGAWRNPFASIEDFINSCKSFQPGSQLLSVIE